MKMSAKCGVHLRHTSRKFLAAVDKIRNMGHPGTLRNILGHRTIRIIMRKMSKIRALGIFFPANCVTLLYSALFFNTNLDHSDDECELIHCVSFVNVAFVMEIELVFHA